MTEEMAGGASGAGEGPDKGAREEGPHSRGRWANNWEFLLCMTGTVISIEAFGSFPYLLFRHGGAVFLIPYGVFLLLFGFPLFFLETALGQYTSEGAITAWRKICPMFTGLGVATQVCMFYLNTYFIVLMAWTFFYLVSSSWSPLPWSTCDWWSLKPCPEQGNESVSDILPYGFDTFTDFNESYATYATDRRNQAELEYFKLRVVRVRNDDALGSVNWDTALCLLLVWVICYFCVWKGHQSIAKVMYVTATFPFLLLLIIFFRAVTLPGAGVGLSYGFYPGFRALTRIDVWVDAAHNVLISLGSCLGVLTTLGSYNKYNTNVYRGCLVICGINVATNLLMACIVYSVVGFLAEMYGTEMHDQFSSGIDLLFVVFPAALSKMPDSNFWALLFFLMIFLLGISTQIMFAETLAKALIDAFPRQLRRPKGRELVVLAMAVVCFLFGLIFVTEGGLLIFLVVDNSMMFTLIFIMALECIIIGWVYGADRFYDNLEDMMGYRPIPLFKYCWMFVSPFICGMLVMAYMSEEHLIVYGHDKFGTGMLWGGIGAILMAVPLLCIPVFVLVSLYKDGENMLTPSSDLRQAKPHKPVLTLCKCVVYGARPPPTKLADHRDEKMMMEEAIGGV